ncbi:MAG: ABC transporter substrate-binding protein [Spirochaetaceae bacterium]|nr:MAG: ABC transporter substrate-binding protein [Spirochaetaceae bacterium]
MQRRTSALVGFLIATMILTPIALFGGGQPEEDGIIQVTMADASWDSILVHNRIVAFILENGFGGYRVDFIPGDTIPLFNGLAAGDIDINMESWHTNFPEAYEREYTAGRIVNLGQNLPDGPQGWWVPRFMIEGDPARGIEPVAPTLRSVADLRTYVELFPDRENPGMGQVIFPPPGWAAVSVSEQILEESELTDIFTGFLPGSGTALAASMRGAYDRGDPWVGYYWEPTAIMYELDMVRLEGSEFPAAAVDVLMNAESAERMPEVREFLSGYSTTVEMNNEFLNVLANEVDNAEQAAEWFLRNREDVWTEWVSDEVARNVRAALQ